jgi:putative glutamine amidotransferase
VALGGTLFQDIELLHPERRVHRNWEIYDQHTHEVRFEPGSFIARWYGAAEGAHVRVNSVHHQGIKDLGRDLIVEARAVPDGVVEAIRYAPHAEEPTPFVYGVQWHPEYMQQAGPDLLDPQVLMHVFLAAVETRRANAAAWAG